MVRCVCGKTQNLESALECDRCGDALRYHPEHATPPGVGCSDDPAFLKRCPVCGLVLADMSGADRDAFFASGKCRACGGKRA